MHYFLFPRRAAAYRIAQSILSDVETAAPAPGTGTQPRISRNQAVGSILQEVELKAAVAPHESREAPSAYPEVSRKLLKVRGSDPRLFDLVLKELNRRVV